MKTHFRLYTDTNSDFHSSIFDLISGDKETKQTKGLAYVFSQYKSFLYTFLEFKPIKDAIKKHLNSNIKYEDISSIEVSAERLTIDKCRADIVIKIDTRKKPLIALIIEAKSIKTNVNQKSLALQISNYLDDKQFPELSNYKKIGIVLTKYSQNIPDVVNISWENVSNLLWNFCKKLKQNEIITQYLKFLTEIDKSMKYYEKEILSIPAGKSLIMVQQYNIYVCPDTRNYNYKRPLFITFRQANGGLMDKLYKIEDIIILNPTNPNEVQALKDSTYPDSVKARISNYLTVTNYNIPIDYDLRFYLLSETESIELCLKPKPQKNNAKFTYYTLKEILTNKIVTPESKQ